MSFHELRHTYLTGLLQSGVDVRTVRELAGHASIATTERYTHPAMDRARDAVENLLSRIIPPRKQAKKKASAKSAKSQYLRDLSGAGNEIRTRDPQLGKLILYH